MSKGVAKDMTKKDINKDDKVQHEIRHRTGQLSINRIKRGPHENRIINLNLARSITENKMWK
jgi:hypothetical protein